MIINFFILFGVLFHFELVKGLPSGVPIGCKNPFFKFNPILIPLFIKGILVDPDIYSNIKNVTEKTIAYLNNGIKYGRNKWYFRINVIKTTDSNEVIRAGKLNFIEIF
jgi:hypothetical protein